ncbi:hypothetical protein SLEP1_g24102 [Rubroshorea leprosula]|uniref:Uncharacterized protein n=1 Tax=Rubroshorea leprosula TaxID=152421 RepID=A0AAV5JER4_9ROSI|nr:hypothetical protein SLEP1_g24102 [Rubroshorea leprosula]
MVESLQASRSVLAANPLGKGCWSSIFVSCSLNSRFNAS